MKHQCILIYHLVFYIDNMYCSLSWMSRGHNKKIVRKEIQETLERYCNDKTDCRLIADCVKESLIYKCTATICNLRKLVWPRYVIYFENQFYANRLPFLVTYMKWKKKCNTSSCMGSLTNCERIFRHKKRVLYSPRAISDHYLSILG